MEIVVMRWEEQDNVLHYLSDGTRYRRTARKGCAAEPNLVQGSQVEQKEQDQQVRLRSVNYAEHKNSGR